MGEGYHAADTCPSIPPDLDEYICEYADGSMDPSVREVFEEYLSANPELADHVHELAETARLLRTCGRHCKCAPDGFQSRLRCAVESECVSVSDYGREWLNKISGIVLAGGTITVVCLAMTLIAVDLASTASGPLQTAAIESTLDWSNRKDMRSFFPPVETTASRTNRHPFRLAPAVTLVDTGVPVYASTEQPLFGPLFAETVTLSLATP